MIRGKLGLVLCTLATSTVVDGFVGRATHARIMKPTMRAGERGPGEHAVGTAAGALARWTFSALALAGGAGVLGGGPSAAVAYDGRPAAVAASVLVSVDQNAAYLGTLNSVLKSVRDIKVKLESDAAFDALGEVRLAADFHHTRARVLLVGGGPLPPLPVRAHLRLACSRKRRGLLLIGSQAQKVFDLDKMREAVDGVLAEARSKGGPEQQTAYVEKRKVIDKVLRRVLDDVITVEDQLRESQGKTGASR
jgi:hypothetical protein